jgi:hypothetical protein
MPVNLIPEENLRTALRPCRVDPLAFEAAVRRRLEAAETGSEDDPLAGLSPLLRSVAGLLPLPLITGCKTMGTAAGLAPAAGSTKLLGYLAFPAVSLFSLFLLLGATVFSVVRIRSIRDGNGSRLGDERAVREGVREWWRRHRWRAGLVLAATLALASIGATWLLFPLYIASFGLLLCVLAGLARRGLANRRLIGQSCLMGLAFLGQIAAFSGMGDDEIHFVDQILLCPAFFWGALVLLPFVMGNAQGSDSRVSRTQQWITGGVFFALVVSITVSFLNPILRPATPSKIKHHVESFEKAPNFEVSWRDWEIVARWAIESKLNPDLSGARRLLAREISGEQNPFVLGSAFRVGLVRTDQIGQLKHYEENRHFLFDFPETAQITSLDQMDWVIRASVLRNDLSPGERDFLEKRLHATIEDLSDNPYDVLETTLRATQLLEVIGRPVDRDRYRVRVHDWLRKFHSKTGGGFEVAGGFKQYLNVPVGSLEATSYAVELMEIYGIPGDLDLNWVRSYLRPLSRRDSDERKWIAAVTRDRLNHLPGATRPTWFAVAYYERSLIAAAVLVGLCIYATLTSPQSKPRGQGVLVRRGWDERSSSIS